MGPRYSEQCAANYQREVFAGNYSSSLMSQCSKFSIENLFYHLFKYTGKEFPAPHQIILKIFWSKQFSMGFIFFWNRIGLVSSSWRGIWAMAKLAL